MTEEQERIKKRVIELEEILYEAQEELKDLQNQCNHEDTSIEDYTAACMKRSQARYLILTTDLNWLCFIHVVICWAVKLVET